MKIAAAQTFVSPDIAANGSAIRKMISSAAADGVRLVNFCEGALSGYAKMEILKPEDWQSFDWTAQEAELRAIADLCGRLQIFAVVGGAHRLGDGYPPHNSLYIFADNGRRPQEREQKRILKPAARCARQNLIIHLRRIRQLCSAAAAKDRAGEV